MVRALVLEAIKGTGITQVADVTNRVQKLAGDHGLFPAEEECRERGVDYSSYRQKRLTPLDEQNVSQVLWDLVVDRVITPGLDTSNLNWPHLRITEFGRLLLEQGTPTY